MRVWVFMCVQSRDEEYVILFDYYEYMAAKPNLYCFFKKLLPFTFINLNVFNTIVEYVILDIRSRSLVFYHFGNRCLKLLNYCRTQVC